MHQIIILAVVQGIAEFLPISSSGHLVILGALMGELSESPTLEIILHAGTLGSILVVFWRRIVKLLSSDQRVIPLVDRGNDSRRLDRGHHQDGLSPCASQPAVGGDHAVGHRRDVDRARQDPRHARASISR